MTRRSWVFTQDGRCIEKGTPEYLAYLGERASGPTIIGDSEEFISPIDGKLYSGKAMAREHNKRHDVVNWRDCAGLPVGVPKAEPDRKEIRAAIIEAARRTGAFDGQ